MRIQFDPGLAEELEQSRQVDLTNGRSLASPALDALNGYSRSLTESGGVRLIYRDQLANRYLDALRVVVWLSGTGTAGWWLFLVSALSFGGCLIGFASAAVLMWLLASRKITQWHSIEIHPDGMIVDGRFFAVDLIGDNWPQLQMRGDDPDRLELAGVYGTRFVVWATACRLSSNDRTPEVLAQDLELAMEQLWGRQDAFVPAAFGSDT